MSGPTPPSAFSPQPSASRVLDHFRASKRRLPLHPLEKAVLIAVAVHLCFLPWALGTMHPWSQITSLVLATIGLILALIPRIYSGDLAVPVAGIQFTEAGSQSPGTGHRPPVTAFRLNPLPRLLKFPIFWIGLALLGYIALQASNPSWVWTRNETSWWLVRVNDIEWLPTSVATPFDRFNIWRQFISYASAWMTTCTVWTGFTRRRSLQVLLSVLVINAVILAIVGSFFRINRPMWYLLWLDEPFLGATTFASFIYKNHAGAYFALLSAVALALAIWTSVRGERTGSKSNPAGILVLIAMLLTLAVLCSLSRGASLILCLVWLATGVWFWLHLRQRSSEPSGNRAVMVSVVLLCVAVMAGTAQYLDFSFVRSRFQSLVQNYQNPAESIHSRLLAHRSADQMLADFWQRGTGAGGFRFLFPLYIKDKPEIYAGGSLFWEHAHSDWREIPIELGLTGTLFLAFGATWWLRLFYRERIWKHPIALPLLLGCFQTLAHAWFDFPFQCPAILCTWLALVAISARWVELESST